MSLGTLLVRNLHAHRSEFRNTAARAWNLNGTVASLCPLHSYLNKNFDEAALEQLKYAMNGAAAVLIAVDITLEC